MNLIRPQSRIMKGGKELLIFRDIRQISEYAAQRWLEVSRESIGRQGRFAAALSGGKTPVGLYRRLAEAERADVWDRIHVFLVDERFVSFEENESNYRMIRQTLLSRVDIPNENIHPMPTDTGSPESAAARYEEDLISFFGTEEGELPRFDMMILGMGSDGHTASLFPGTDALSESVRLAVAVTAHDATTQQRISITFPVINNAEHIIFQVTGKEKAGLLQEIIENPECDLPAARVHPQSGKIQFLVDEPASRLIV